MGRARPFQWAAKEAAYKAFGTMRIPFPELCVQGGGKLPPALRFEGQTKDVMAASGVGRSFLSLSHDGDYAMAQVILECEGKSPAVAEGPNPGVVPEYEAMLRGNKAAAT